MVKVGILLGMALVTGCANGADPSAVERDRNDKMRAGMSVQPSGDADAVEREKPFLDENDAAMRKMMAGMTVQPSGDVDRDFVAMMAPHHQGAIDMAIAELRYGRNPQLRRLAQEIIVTQQEEIAAMHLALDQPLPPSVASPTTPAAATGTP